MNRFCATSYCLLFCLTLHSQQKTDNWLRELLTKQASPFLQQILSKPDTFQYQLIYTRIDRDRNNHPSFTNFYYNVDRNRYFNPASMVKMPVAFCALEKLNELNQPGLNRNTPMLTDSSYEQQTTVWYDTTAANGMPSVAHYIRKIFLVSDNDAYNRLYEFVGQESINTKLWQKGYKNSRITRRFVYMNEDQNRHTNSIRFEQNGKLVYHQPALYNIKPFNFSQKYYVGHAHFNRNDSLINAPMDFTTHNNMPLEDLQQISQSVLFPESVHPSRRFNLTQRDYQLLYQCMSQYPGESQYPSYDTTAFFDSFTKFFFFKAGRGTIPPYIRSFNKTGWSYGFLTDVAYIVDLKNNIEFMLSGVIYVNHDGIINDDKYEYEQIGYPFFKETGQIIYQYELQRPRTYKPNLQKFTLKYDGFTNN